MNFVCMDGNMCIYKLKTEGNIKSKLAESLPMAQYGVRIISNTHFLAQEMRFSLKAGYENIETESDLTHTEI